MNPKQLRSGRKVVGPEVYKNIAEFNEICTAQGKRQNNHEAKSRRSGRIWCEAHESAKCNLMEIPSIG